MDLSADHMAWDGTEAVTLELSSRADPVAVAVPVAKRRAVRTAQRSPSGGVYLGHEIRWLVPARVLPAGAEPAPADVVVDSEDVRWTVLTRERNRQRQTYLLGCVDLTLAHGLRDVVTVERATLAPTASGAPEKVFDRVLAVCQARVQELTRQVAEARGVRWAKGRYDVVIDRQLRGLDVAEDRVRWVDQGQVRHLDVIGYRQPERIDELPVIECELR